MRYVLSFLMLFSFSAVLAQDGYYDYLTEDSYRPVDGMWYDPDESGRGMSVEFQDERLLISYYGYDEDGKAMWWQGVGHKDEGGDINTYSGVFSAFDNGQCVGCAYVQPNINEDKGLGEFTINFESGNKATMDWAGGTTSMIKYYYGYTSTLDRMKGMWFLSYWYSTGGQEVSLLTLNDERTHNGAKVLTGFQTIQGTYSIAATTFTSASGREVAVVAGEFLGEPWDFNAFYLDNYYGYSGFDNSDETGAFLYSEMGPRSYKNAAPVTVHKVADLSQASDWIDYISNKNKSLDLDNQRKMAASKGTKSVSLSPQLVEAAELLAEVLDELVSEAQ